jgi:rod shape-determining protein MreD
VKPLAIIAFALLLSALQAALLRWAGGGVFSLMLPVACVVYLAIYAGNVEGSVGAAGVGYVLDLSSGTPKGLMTFLAVAAFVGVRAVNAAVDVRGRLGFAALTALSTFLVSAGALGLSGLVAAPGVGPGLGLLPRAVVEALCTGALSPLVLGGMKRLDGLFGREDQGLLR